MKRKLNPEVKISEAKHKEFEALISDLIQSGYDIQLDNGQSEIRLWLPEGRMIAIVLKADGRWETQ